MGDHYEAFLQAGIDLSPFGWERCDDFFEPYYCTPRRARVLGCAGVDGIHYCTIPEFGEMIFAVSPMNFGDCVHPIARNFRDLLRLLLAGADLAALEQCYAWDEEQYRAFVQDAPETEAQRTARAAIRAAFALSPVEDAFRYVKDLQRGFDLSRVPYTEEYYETVGEPAAEPTPWRVSFSGGFWSDKDGGGEALALGRRFVWDGRDWLIPAVYVFPEGLVVDFCAEVEPSRLTAFFDKWNLWQGESAARSEEEQETMERENPLCVDFDAEVLWNGAVLQQQSGCGVCWLPPVCQTEGTENDPAAAALLAHYALDESRGWSLQRRSFPFPAGAEQPPHALTIRLMAEAQSFSGGCFTVSAAGQSATLTHPCTGERFTLTVTAFEPETLPAAAFPDPTREFPTALVTMHYTLTPERAGGFQLRDCAPADTPRPRTTASPQDGSAVIGIIGGADGPVAVFSAPRGAAGRAACSALHFAPPQQVTWRAVFREKPAEDITVTLI